MKPVQIKLLTVFGSAVLFLLTATGDVSAVSILIGTLVLLLVEGGWVSAVRFAVKFPNKNVQLGIVSLSMCLALVGYGTLRIIGYPDLGFAVLCACAIGGVSSAVLVSPIKTREQPLAPEQPKRG